MSEIDKACIDLSANLKDALQAITNSGTGIALIIGKRDRLVGILQGDCAILGNVA